MDWETEAAAARAAKMEELRQLKEVLRNSSTEIAGIVQDQQALAQWLALGGSDEGFSKILPRQFMALSPAQKAAFVRGTEVLHG